MKFTLLLVLLFGLAVDPVAAQINAGDVAQLVSERLPENRRLLQTLGDTSDDLVVCLRKLDRALPEQIHTTGWWGNVLQLSSKTDDRMQAMARSLRVWIAADELFLQRVKPGSIDRSAVAEQVRAAYDALSRFSVELGSLTTAFESEGITLRTIPEQFRELAEYRTFRKALDDARNAIEDLNPAIQKRLNDYSRMTRVFRTQ